MTLFSLEGFLFLLRWIHLMAGIIWIGLLYYFNFVQTPFFATALGVEARSAMTRGLMPSALQWFSWGATLTFLSGWTIVVTHLLTGTASVSYFSLILTGGMLGSIMWCNAWFVITPWQRLEIASAEAVAAGGQAIPEVVTRAPVAGRALRTSTLLSVPVLFFMSSARNLSIARSEDPSYVFYLVFVLVVALLFELNIFAGNATTQKPLATVASTIRAGLGLTLVLFVAASALL
jgi:uncharacterized membrane protein